MMYHDTIDYSQYNISDTEKFLVMTKVFPELFVSQKAFAEEIGENPQTVNSWIKLKTRKLKAIPKSEICRVFGLIDTVWDCELSTQENFREVLKKDYRKKRKGVNIFIMEEENDIKEQSLLEQAIAYKRNDRIKEALESIKKIERSPSSFKYIHHDEIQHLKAILLSDDTIQDWDTAIDILRKLYFVSEYHFKKPEIITLLASNHKRKALFGANNIYRDKEEVDMNLISKALTLYDDGYEIKDSQERYYDAINWAYLRNIASVIESNRLDTPKVKERFEELKKAWRVDEKNWWEVISYAEFSMLVGDITFAKNYVDNFLERHPVDPDEIKATMRQIKLYIYFTQDKNAIEFFEHLGISLEHL